MLPLPRLARLQVNNPDALNVAHSFRSCHPAPRTSTMNVIEYSRLINGCEYFGNNIEATMALAEKINHDITKAMKDRDAVRLSTLRMMKTALTLRETELPGSIDDAEAVRVLQKLVSQRKDAAEQFRNGGRLERAEQEEAEALLIQSYLPEAPREEEMREAVQKAIESLGASSVKDMGAVMKAVKAQFEGKSVDGKALSDLVKAKLSS
jgi:uncharacterized protein